jgi:hypothetical protein
LFTQICSKKREGKWSEDEDNDLYFTWHDQTLVGDTSHRQPWKQFWEGLMQTLTKEQVEMVDPCH